MIGVADAAHLLGLEVTKVRQMVRRRELIGSRDDGTLRIPAEFLADGTVIKGLSGTITLLSDAGLTDREILDWLFAADDSLGGSAMQSLRSGSVREVHRRAQVVGF